MTAGARIKAARLAAGLTQSELANKLGVPYQSIGQWERDIRNPKIETLKKISNALDISPYELYSDELRAFVDEFAADNVVLTKEEREERDKYAEKSAREYPIRKDAEKKMLYRLARDDNYDFSENEKNLIAAFSHLNDTGQTKAVERVEELTEIPKYQKVPSKGK